MIRLAPMHLEITARIVAQLNHDDVYRHHGRPSDVICDRGTVFFLFWQSLTYILKVNITASSAYHLEIDGKTEVMNKKIEEYLCCFVYNLKGDWDLYLVAAEVVCHQSLRTDTTYSSFFLDYGFEPLTVPMDALGDPESEMPAVSEWLATYDGSRNCHRNH